MHLSACTSEAATIAPHVVAEFACYMSVYLPRMCVACFDVLDRHRPAPPGGKRRAPRPRGMRPRPSAWPRATLVEQLAPSAQRTRDALEPNFQNLTLAGRLALVEQTPGEEVVFVCVGVRFSLTLDSSTSRRNYFFFISEAAAEARPVDSLESPLGRSRPPRRHPPKPNMPARTPVTLFRVSLRAQGSLIGRT